MSVKFFLIYKKTQQSNKKCLFCHETMKTTQPPHMLEMLPLRISVDTAILHQIIALD